jgi:hypothetical protein
VFDYYYYDIAKSILSSFGMYLFVSHFAISSIFELFEIAGMGVLIYVVIMFLVGGFSGHELSLIRRYLFRAKSEVKQ